MKLLSRLLVAAAAAGFLFALWKLDPSVVWGHVRSVGWGLPIIFLQPIPVNLFNTLGWRFALRPEDEGGISFARLFRLRIVGDGVNILTPSGTLGGELVRAAALGGGAPSEPGLASVAVAKFTQTSGQGLFVLAGLLFLCLRGGLLAPSELRWAKASAGVVAGLLLLLAAGAAWASRRYSEGPVELSTGWLGAFKNTPRWCARFLRDHPGRFAASVSMFFLGYSWFTVEAWLLCRFLGVPVTAAQALGVEALSNMVHAAFFMVPARVGTMELGSTGIFAALGLGAGAGFAFGVVRHMRELAWSAAGLALARQ